MSNQPKDFSLKRLSGIKEGFARLLSPKSRPAHGVICACPAGLYDSDVDSDEEEEEEEKGREVQMTDHPSSEIKTPSLTTGTAINSSAYRDDGGSKYVDDQPLAPAQGVSQNFFDFNVSAG